MSNPEYAFMRGMDVPLPHPLDLAPHPAMPKRQWVPPELRPWDAELPSEFTYQPVWHEATKIMNGSYPDVDPAWEDIRNHPFAQNYVTMGLVIGEHGPLNPFTGRTGVVGRGPWRRHGPNYTADLVDICICEDETYARVALRADSGKVALPGGKLELTDHPDRPLQHYSELFVPEVRLQVSRVASLREIKEETGAPLPEQARLYHVGTSPTGGARTTDTAWAVSDVWAHVSRTNRLPRLYTEDENILGALWLPLSEQAFGVGKDSLFHSAHGSFVQTAVQQRGLVVPRTWSKEQQIYITEQLYYISSVAGENFTRQLMLY